MRQPVVDYRQLRLSNINEPRFRHVKLLLGWVAYFALYLLTENLIPASACHPMHCALDDLIPFDEFFVLFYVGWYALVFGALAFTLFFNVEGFRKMQTFIIITQLVAMAIYIVFPSRQDLRPDSFERQNFFTWILGLIYGFETSTGVCPSLHVAYSLGILSVGLKDKLLHPAWKAALAFFVVMVCVSVCFVKQHSAVDVFAALPLGLLAEILVYGKDWWLPRLRKRPPEHNA